jgi:hypothetical protein
MKSNSDPDRARTWNWKEEVSKATHQVASDIETSGLELASQISRALDKIGFHKLAHLFDTPQRPSHA